MFHVFKMAEQDIEDSPVGVSSPTVLIIGAILLRPHDLGVLDVERSAPSSTTPPPPHPTPPLNIPYQRWSSEMNNDTRKDPNQSNKMRTYRKLKKIDNYRCEDYLHQVTNIRHRTTMTKLRLSNHRLAIETGRYIRPYKKPNERICPLCKKEAEDEKHFLISCSVYQEKQKSLFECLSNKFKLPIVKMSTENIFLLLLNPPSNNAELQKIIAKHMHDLRN